MAKPKDFSGEAVVKGEPAWVGSVEDVCAWLGRLPSLTAQEWNRISAAAWARVTGSTRCLVCNAEFSSMGVAPVQVGGSFYHPGCQPVAPKDPEEFSVRGLTGTDRWVRTDAGAVSSTHYPAGMYEMLDVGTGPVGSIAEETSKQYPRITGAPNPPPRPPCQNHPEVTLEAAEPCWKCAAWGWPEVKR